MLSQSCDYSISIFTNILSPMHCWGRVASSKVSIVITSIFSILFAIYSLKGVIYAVLITVACFSLQQGLHSTLTGRLGTKTFFSESVGYFRWPQKVWFNCSLLYSPPAPALCHRTLFTTLSQQCQPFCPCLNQGDVSRGKTNFKSLF